MIVILNPSDYWTMFFSILLPIFILAWFYFPRIIFLWFLEDLYSSISAKKVFFVIWWYLFNVYVFHVFQIVVDKLSDKFWNFQLHHKHWIQAGTWGKIVISNIRNLIYKLLGEFSNNFWLRISWNREILEKSQNCMDTD